MTSAPSGDHLAPGNSESVFDDESASSVYLKCDGKLILLSTMAAAGCRPGHPVITHRDRAAVVSDLRIALPVLSAWESDRSRPMKALNSQLGRPAVAVVDRLSPWLIAR